MEREAEGDAVDRVEFDGGGSGCGGEQVTLDEADVVTRMQFAHAVGPTPTTPVDIPNVTRYSRFFGQI